MFDIRHDEGGNIMLIGRLDASQVEKVRLVLKDVTTSRTIDFKDLTYISSAGLGTLLAAQKRLANQAQSLALVNLNAHIKDIFLLAGFDLIFKID